MASSSRDSQVPPANLKERIAQLQQRNVSPPGHPSAPNEKPGAAPPGAGSLRDRIARFEKKGSVPVPRGSFGMGAPPAENGPKKTGELYANRIQGLGKPTSRPTSPELLDGQPKQRSASSFATVGETAQERAISPPLPKSASTTASRSNSLVPPVDFATMRSVSSPDVPQARDITLDPASPADKPASPPPPAEPVSSPTVDDAPSTSADTSEGEAPASVLNEEPQEISTEPSNTQTTSEPTIAIDAASPPDEAPPSALAPAPATPEPASITKPAPYVAPAPPSPAPALPKVSSSGPSKVVITNITRTTSPPAQFSAVVHRKVTETPTNASATSTTPDPVATPKAARPQRAKVPVTVETPSSPAVELAALLENAFLLESRLGDGGSPFDSQSLKTPTADSFAASVAQAPVPTITEPEPLFSPAAPVSDEENTLSEKQSIRSVSAPSIPSIREPTIDQDIPEESEPDFGTQSIHSQKGYGGGDASERSSVRSKGSTTRHYFNSLRRLASGGSSRPTSTYNARDSMSFSSEDSGVIVTPPSDGASVQWSSSAPQSKKGSMGRSSSFADKLFNRGRARSANSDTDDQSVKSYGSSLTPRSLSKNSKGKSGHGKAATDSEATRSSKFDLDAFPSVPSGVPTHGASTSSLNNHA